MQQYFYKKSNFKPTPGRHIKSYEQLQSLIHEAFMKILLKILKRKDRSSGIKKKKSIWVMQFQESGKGFLTLSLLEVSWILQQLPTFMESSLVTGLISIHH